MNLFSKLFQKTAAQPRQSREQEGETRVILTLPSTCDGRMFSAWVSGCAR